jgi:hypothetical protein
LQALFACSDFLNKKGYTSINNPDVRRNNPPFYMLIDPELALYSMCTAEKAKEYEK